MGQRHLRSNLAAQQNSHIPGSAQAVSPRCLMLALGCKDGYTGVHLCAACLAGSMGCDTEVSLAAACLWPKSSNGSCVGMLVLSQEGGQPSEAVGHLLTTNQLHVVLPLMALLVIPPILA